jgi:hypothetical protein
MSAQYAAVQNTRFPQNANADFRLPSIRDLDLSHGRAVVQGSAPTDVVSTPQDHPTRYSHQWSRQSHSVPHQQHTPPLSAGHEASVPKVEYSSKHPPASYLQPGVPLQPQVNSIPNSLTMGPSSRNEEPPRSPGQSKRTRTSSASIHVLRDARPSHVSITLLLPALEMHAVTLYFSITEFVHITVCFLPTLTATPYQPLSSHYPNLAVFSPPARSSP